MTTQPRMMSPAERIAWQAVESAEEAAREAVSELEAAMERFDDITHQEGRRERARARLHVVRASEAGNTRVPPRS
jgi:hypothetical protein